MCLLFVVKLISHCLTFGFASSPPPTRFLLPITHLCLANINTTGSLWFFFQVCFIVLSCVCFRWSLAGSPPFHRIFSFLFQKPCCGTIFSNPFPFFDWANMMFVYSLLSCPWVSSWFLTSTHNINKPFYYSAACWFLSWTLTGRQANPTDCLQERHKAESKAEICFYECRSWIFGFLLFCCFC